ncbi:hypothetical protein [Mycobacterium sp. 852002-30065_SCH5024008]|nr:hypothetical protein [Mycobacterium sp. 852002-30065_SCH5024008]
MKAKDAKKTLKVATVAVGLAAMLLIPTGCAATAGTTCTVNALGQCI